MTVTVLCPKCRLEEIDAGFGGLCASCWLDSEVDRIMDAKNADSKSAKLARKCVAMTRDGKRAK